MFSHGGTFKLWGVSYCVPWGNNMCFLLLYYAYFSFTNLIFSINLVLLQRTQEDESNNTLFDIADLHMLQAMGSKTKIRKFIMYETCDIIGVSDASGNINYSFLQLKFLLDILIIAFSCFIKKLIISLQTFFWSATLAYYTSIIPKIVFTHHIMSDGRVELRLVSM